MHTYIYIYIYTHTHMHVYIGPCPGCVTPNLPTNIMDFGGLDSSIV